MTTAPARAAQDGGAVATDPVAAVAVAGLIGWDDPAARRAEAVRLIGSEYWPSLPPGDVSAWLPAGG